MTCAAGRAIAAWREGAHGHTITKRKTFYGRAERDDCAGHLMTEHLWNVDAVVHSAAENVKVCPADAAMGNLNLHLGGPRWNRRAFADAYPLVPFVKGGLELTH
jgi:hypothetical protein